MMQNKISHSGVFYLGDPFQRETKFFKITNNKRRRKKVLSFVSSKTLE